jgi:hypothetical protein
MINGFRITLIGAVCLVVWFALVSEDTNAQQRRAAGKSLFYFQFISMKQ